MNTIKRKHNNILREKKHSMRRTTKMQNRNVACLCWGTNTTLIYAGWNSQCLFKVANCQGTPYLRTPKSFEHDKAEGDKA